MRAVHSGAEEGASVPQVQDGAIPSAKGGPCRCSKCGAIPEVRAKHLRVYGGRTGWRVFCGTGEHNASSGYRAHKVDAIADWNALHAFAARTGRDPAKMETHHAMEQAASDADKAWAGSAASARVGEPQTLPE